MFLYLVLSSPQVPTLFKMLQATGNCFYFNTIMPCTLLYMSIYRWQVSNYHEGGGWEIRGLSKILPWGINHTIILKYSRCSNIHLHTLWREDIQNNYIYVTGCVWVSMLVDHGLMGKGYMSAHVGGQSAGGQGGIFFMCRLSLSIIRWEHQ